jgi:transcriptional regulator with XRE-family HTH domain
MVNQFGGKIKQLREKNNLLQRQVASALEIDTPMLSKIERGERKAKREQVILFAEVLKANKNELLTLWLADQLIELSKDENMALDAIHIAEQSIKNQTKKIKQK